MTRLPARVAPRIGALCAVALGAAAAWAASALAWSSPAAIYANAAPQVLAVAGDPAGNAFAVYEGGTLDAPLLLSERSVRSPVSDLMSLAWSSPRPLPGNVESFTNAAPSLTAATAAASGDGAGAVALRYGASLLTALVREPDRDFAVPATIAGGAIGRIDVPAVSVSDSGATVVAFHAAGGRSGSGRVHYSFRPPGGLFTRVNALASSDSPAPVGRAGGGRLAGHRVDEPHHRVRRAHRRHGPRDRATAPRAAHSPRRRSSRPSASAATGSSRGSTPTATCASCAAARRARSPTPFRSTAPRAAPS